MTRTGGSTRMKVVVVGGTGNISTAVVDLLLRCGHDVTVFSRGSRPVPEGARPLIGDRRDPESFERAIRDGDFEVAIDMMAFTPEDAESGLRAYAGVGHLIHTSTSMVYGEARHHVFTSEDHPTLATEAYGSGKAAIDAIYLDAHARHGFPVTVLRPSNTYGGPGFLVLRQVGGGTGWVDRTRAGKPIVVSADGLALSRFLHVDDAALAYVGVIDRPETIGQVYNLVDPRIVTWADYHRAAMDAVGREVELVGVPFAALEAAEIPGFGLTASVFAYHNLYDDAKIRRDIPEFVPRVSLVDGLARTFELAAREGRLPATEPDDWEDRIVERWSR